MYLTDEEAYKNGYILSRCLLVILRIASSVRAV